MARGASACVFRLMSPTSSRNKQPISGFQPVLLDGVLHHNSDFLYGERLVLQHGTIWGGLPAASLIMVLVNLILRPMVAKAKA